MSSPNQDPLRDETDGDGQDNARELAKRAPRVQPTDRVPTHTEVSDTPGIEDASVGGTRFLSHLLTRSPFLDYFLRVAEASNTGKVSENRVRKAQQEHPTLFRFCLVLDMLLRVVVVVLLLVVTAAVAYKTLWPLTSPSTG